LVELQRAYPKFKERGIELVGISYDSPAILKFFTARSGISFPLLADPHSRIIRRFGLLNPRGQGMTAGMAIPGFIYVGPRRRIREMFFEDNDLARYTANNMLGKLFPQLADAARKSIPAPHIRVNLTQSDAAVIPGNRVTLDAVISLPAGVHVYAPGVQGGYRPISLKLDPSPDAAFHGAVYPCAQVIYLPVIREKVPVLEGTFRISEDVTLSYQPGFNVRIMKGPASGTAVTLKGNLFYQACNQKICFLPASIPVSWTLTVMHLDRIHAPEAIRHKAPSRSSPARP